MFFSIKQYDKTFSFHLSSICALQLYIFHFNACSFTPFPIKHNEKETIES